MKAPGRFIVPMFAVAIVGLAGASSDVRSADQFSIADLEAALTRPGAMVQGTTTGYHGSGAFVQTNQGDERGSVGISAFLASDNNTSSVILTYSASYYDPESLSCVENPDLTTTCVYTRIVFDLALGPIGPADVEAGAKTARLVTDLANHPAIPLSRCVLDNVAATYTCVEIPLTGTIDLTWTATREFERTTRGSTVTRSGPNTTKSTGTTTERSADARGTAFGKPHVSSFGGANIGLLSSRYIEIHRPYR